MKLLLIIVCVILTTALGRSVLSVVANVRGRKFDLKADTVGDFVAQVEKLAGLTPGQQSVLFRGKLLGSSEKLSEAGVSNGDVLNVLKGRKTKIPHKPVPFKAPSVQQSSSSSSSKSRGFPSFPGFGSAPGATPEQMKESLARMEEMLDSGFFDQFFSDPEQLEKARVQLKDNLDQYDKMMPGFREQAEGLVSSPEKWKEAMNQAKKQIENLKQMRSKGSAIGKKNDKTSDTKPRKDEPVEEPKGEDEEESTDE